MAVFAWQRHQCGGKEVKGLDDADNPKALRSCCSSVRACWSRRLEEERRRSAEARGPRRRLQAPALACVKQTDLALTTRQLATLLEAGIPLVEALDALIEQSEKEDLRSALTNTRDKVNEGIALARRSRAHPQDLRAALHQHGRGRRDARATSTRCWRGSPTCSSRQNRLKSKVHERPRLSGRDDGA